MLEAGRKYRIRMIEAGEEREMVCLVKAVELPLITISEPPAEDRIVNTSSQNFISAEAVSDDADPDRGSDDPDFILSP